LTVAKKAIIRGSLNRRALVGSVTGLTTRGPFFGGGVMAERALFLIDGPNFYKNLEFGNLNRKHLDYMRLARNLAMSRLVVDVVLFTSPVDRLQDAATYTNQQRFFAAFQAAGGTLKLGRLVSRTRECKHCGHREKFKTEKSVDVMLVMDIVLRCTEYDILYLFSCDTDLIPAIRHVRRIGKKVFSVRPIGANCAGVGNECNSSIVLTQQHIDAAQVNG
jgi:uncharacterized LabA/DUF88 family protein